MRVVIDLHIANAGFATRRAASDSNEERFGLDVELGWSGVWGCH